MRLYRFSPIENKDQLLKAIKYIHFACFKLCDQIFGEYLPVAGNIGVFCHYDGEYKFLTNLREELTDQSDNFNQKYYRLHNPIIIPAKANIPEAVYTYIYIRKPDPYRGQTGDGDFVLEPVKYAELKKSILDGKRIKGARIFERPEDDMIELYDPDIDALAFITTSKISEKVTRI